jgi:hypothetical protein
MITKNEIINNMCMTFRHDYGIEISEEDKMYTLSSGMTRREREALFRDMKQVFDNDILPIFEKYNIKLD